MLIISMIIAGGTILCPVCSAINQSGEIRHRYRDGGERLDDGSGPFFRVTFFCRALFMGDTLWIRAGVDAALNNFVALH